MSQDIEMSEIIYEQLLIYIPLQIEVLHRLVIDIIIIVMYVYMLWFDQLIIEDSAIKSVLITVKILSLTILYLPV